MPSTAAPYGLVPVEHPSGTIRPSQYAILTGYATGILQNQPVKIHTDGTINAAAVGDRFIGTFQGVTYTDANGVQQFANQWTASTAGTNIIAWVTRDPNIIYQIQGNATLTQGTIGQQFDFSAASGSTVTGLSTQSLDVASSAANASLQIIGLNPAPDNAWGDTYPNVLVRISEHQFVADVAAF